MFEKLQRDYRSLFANSEQSNRGVDDGSPGRFRISDFFEQWGWEYSVSLCIEDSGLNEDSIYEWNVLRFYNKLAYLKDKGKFEIALNGNR